MSDNTSSTVKMFSDAASAAMLGYAVYNSINKMVNPKDAAVGGIDVISEATKAVQETINKQIETLTAAIKDILPAVPQGKPTTPIPSPISSELPTVPPIIPTATTPVYTPPVQLA